MGYDLHITRKDDWSDEEGPTITPEEWLVVAQADPELTPTGDSSGGVPYFSYGNHGGLWYIEGELRCKSPDEPMIRKMSALAERLVANVQGDDGERYPKSLQIEEKTRQRNVRSFVIGYAMIFVFSCVGLLLAIFLIYPPLSWLNVALRHGGLMKDHYVLGVAYLAALGIELSVILVIRAWRRKRSAGANFRAP